MSFSAALAYARPPRRLEFESARRQQRLLTVLCQSANRTMKRVARCCACCGRTPSSSSESHGDECLRPGGTRCDDSYPLSSNGNRPKMPLLPLSESWQRIEACPDRLQALAESIEDFSELLMALESAGLLHGQTKAGGVDIVDSTVGVQYIPVLPSDVVQPVEKLSYILGRIQQKDEETFRRFKRTLIENGEFKAIEIAQPSREQSPTPVNTRPPPLYEHPVTDLDVTGYTDASSEPRSVPETPPPPTAESTCQAEGVTPHSEPPTPPGPPLSEEGVRDMLYRIVSFDDDTLRRYRQRLLHDQSGSRDPFQTLYNGLQPPTSPTVGGPAEAHPNADLLPRFVDVPKPRQNDLRDQYFGEEVDAHVAAGPTASTSTQAGGSTQQLQVRAADTPVPAGPHVYSMLSHPRGLCVIFNIQHFPGLPDKERPGSQLDQERMERLFQSFGFIVNRHVNSNSASILRLLESYATRIVHESHDAFVCIIMSHGEQHHVYGSDYCTVKLKSVFELFNNSNCPAMRERPKIFFIQACRGHLPDNGCSARNDDLADLDELSRSMAQVSVNERGDAAADDPNQSDAGPYQGTGNLAEAGPSHGVSEAERRISVWSDMYIAYAVVEGYESLRDSTTGSWFLKAVFDVMARESYRYDLDTLMEHVHDRVLARSRYDGQRQCPEVRKIGWRKKLFFNPGL